MSDTSKIVIVDYIGNCNSKGEATGHVLKTLKEAEECLGDEYKVKYILTNDYTKYFDKHSIEYTFKHSSRVNYSNGFIKKFWFKLMKTLAVIQVIRKEKNIWFLNTDFYFYLGLLLTFIRDKKIFVTNYIDYEKDDGFLRKIKKKIYRLSMKKISVEFTTNPHKKEDKCVFIPDYSFDRAKYSKYFYTDKEERVYMCGGINEAKDVEGLISTFNKNQQPLVIKGNFSSKNQYKDLLKETNQNISLEHVFLNEDHFYYNIASSKYIILPYKKENYYHRSSGIILEAVFLGAIVIAPKFVLEFLKVDGIGYNHISELDNLRLDAIDINQIQKIKNNNMKILKDYDSSIIQEKYLEVFSKYLN